MAQNFIACGEVVDYTNTTGSTIASGSLVVFGAGAGVALVTIEAGDVGSVMMEGIFELPKTASLAIAQGDQVYYNTSTKRVTKTNTDTKIGIASESALSADAVVRVLLHW